MARHDQWLLGLIDQFGCGGDLVIRRLARDFVAGQLGFGGPDKFRLLAQQYVPGNVHQNGAGAPGAGDVERVMDGLGHIFNVHDQHVVFSYRQGHAGNVCFLECVGADGGPWHLSGDRHQGDRVHLGGGDAGNQVGGAGARRGDTDADLAGGAGVAVSGHDGGLLVAHQDVADGRVAGEGPI